MTFFARARCPGEETAAAASLRRRRCSTTGCSTASSPDEELWACTSCRACVQECPVSIDQLDVINQMRRYLVLSESRFPEEVQPAFESLERNGSPWHSARPIARNGRGARHSDDAEAMERGDRPDILFWSAAWDRSTTAPRRSPLRLREF